MLLSLPATAKIRSVTFDGKTSAVSLDDLALQNDAGVYVYDFYGNKKRVRIGEVQDEEMFLIACASGEPMFVGAQHTILCRPEGTGTYVRLPLSMLNGMMQAHVRLPHKRITPDETIIEAMDFDDKEQTIVLRPEKASQFVSMMDHAASCGLTVKRHRNEKKIILDYMRPICFANKLLIGAFQSDLFAALDNLAAGGVIQPWKMFGQEFVNDTLRTDIIFEGNCIYAEVAFLTAKPTGRKSKVRHVIPEDPNTPVELPWFMT